MEDDVIDSASVESIHVLGGCVQLTYDGQKSVRKIAVAHMVGQLLVGDAETERGQRRDAL